jgi:hypothetical protein
MLISGFSPKYKKPRRFGTGACLPAKVGMDAHERFFEIS